MARQQSAPFACVMSEDRDLAPKLERIGDNSQPIKLGDLAALSDLADDDLALFQSEWPLFEQTHRRSLAQAMQELSEESLELDFRAAFLTMLEDDDDAAVRISAARGLIEDTRRSTMRRLLQALTNDNDETVRATVATTLGAWTLQVAQGDLDQRISSEIEQTLLAVFNDVTTAKSVRQRLLETLGYLGDHADIMQAIETAFHSADDSWQQSALAAMGHTGMKRWLPSVKEALDDDNEATRFEAARAAGGLADLARPILRDVARLSADDDIEVATTAIWALGQIGGDEAKRFLEKLAQEGEGARLEAATEALHELEFFDDPMGNLALADEADEDDLDDEE